MAEAWTILFDGKLENRNVKIEKHYDGGYRATTTLKGDHSGVFESNEDYTLHIPPKETGSEIFFESDTKESLLKDMIDEGFPQDGIKDIIGNIR